MPYVVCHGLGFLHWSRCIGLALLLRQLARMHHHKAQLLLGDASITVFDLYLAAHTLAMPAPGCLVLRPPRFLHQQEQGGLHVPLRFEFLPDSTRARDECDEIDLALKTYPESTTTIGLTIRDDATHPCQT
jgi:hypothetical protein